MACMVHARLRASTRSVAEVLLRVRGSPSTVPPGYRTKAASMRRASSHVEVNRPTKKLTSKSTRVDFHNTRF